MNALSPFPTLRRVCADTRGASAVEYGLILAAIMLVILVGLSQASSSLQDILTEIAQTLQLASR